MKKLENEYRQLMQSETPDLWSRIEAGIDAKIATGNVVEFTEKKPVKKRNTGANLWKKYSLPLVACIAAIICVPLLLTGFIRMASGGKADTAEMAADTAAADCAAPEETMSVTTDCADEPAATIVTEEACDEEVDDAVAEVYDAAAEMESAPAENAESMLDGAVTESTSEDSKQSAESYAGSLQVLTVTQISQEQRVQDLEELKENCEKGEVYYLTTEEAGECTLFVPADAEFTVDMNAQLKIRVKVSDEDYDYVFVEMAE